MRTSRHCPWHQPLQLSTTLCSQKWFTILSFINYSKSLLHLFLFSAPFSWVSIFNKLISTIWRRFSHYLLYFLGINECPHRQILGLQRLPLMDPSINFKVCFAVCAARIRMDFAIRCVCSILKFLLFCFSGPSLLQSFYLYLLEIWQLAIQEQSFGDELKKMSIAPQSGAQYQGNPCSSHCGSCPES